MYVETVDTILHVHTICKYHCILALEADLKVKSNSAAGVTHGWTVCVLSQILGRHVELYVMTAHEHTCLQVHVHILYVYIMVCMCTTEHFLFVCADLWEKLMSPPSVTKTLPWKGSWPVSYSYLEKDSVQVCNRDSEAISDLYTVTTMHSIIA